MKNTYQWAEIDLSDLAITDKYKQLIPIMKQTAICGEDTLKALRKYSYLLDETPVPNSTHQSVLSWGQQEVLITTRAKQELRNI